MVRRNPFKPTAGAVPPLLVGRDEILDEFDESIDDGPGAPLRLVNFTGPRGVGKTVMLAEVAATVERRGWVVLQDTSTPGLARRLSISARAARSKLDAADRRGRRITGLTLPSVLGSGGGGVTLEAPTPQDSVDLRGNVNELLDVTEPHDAGVLITIDEVHGTARADLREVATVFQHLVTEGRNVAFAFAGLPSAVTDLLNDDVLTFLRRATPFYLSDVPLAAVREAFAETVEESSRSITPEALDAVTAATGGYPFMIQLVGYHVWRKAAGGVIDMGSAELGIPAAQKRLGSTVHAAALSDLSNVDKTYLLAMAQDSSASKTSAIAARLGESERYAGVYRARLIKSGVIHEAGYGYVDFAIPFLREYLNEHAATNAMTAQNGAADHGVSG